jgi:hypothetical protein
MSGAKLSDDEVYNRLHRALEVLGTEEGETVHADTAIKGARKALRMMQIGILAVQEGLTEKP